MSEISRHKPESSSAKGRGIDRRTFVTTAAAGATAAAVAPAFIGRARAATAVKLGLIQPLTGPSAAPGIRGRDGCLFAIRELQEKGGFTDNKGNAYTVDAPPAGDMANDPKQAIILFRGYAVDPDIVAVLGPTNSVGYVPCIPVAPQLKLPIISNGSGANVKQWNTWAYRVNPTARSAVPVMLKTLVQKEGVRRLAVIYDQTQDGQKADATVCQEMQGELGYEVVAFEAFKTGDQDFSVQITKVKAAKPDAVYVAAATGDGVHVSLQLDHGGVDAPQITGYANFTDPVWWDGSRGAIEGGYTYLGADMRSDVITAWVEKYNSMFDLEPIPESTHGYNSVYAVVEAIRRAGSADRTAIMNELTHLEFTSPLGAKITFENPPHGDNLTPSVAVVRITGRADYEVIS